MTILIAIADQIDAFLRVVAEVFSWAFIALIVVICADVVTRKFGFQFPEFGSTRLQELEWHLHAILFCTWIGFAYVRDVHVRIDVFTSRLHPRKGLGSSSPVVCSSRCPMSSSPCPTRITSSWSPTFRTRCRTRRTDLPSGGS